MNATSLDRIERSRETRLRRMARRQGLRLTKSRTRTHKHLSWATFGLVDIQSNACVAYAPWASGYGLSLDEVESFLADE